MGALQVTTRLAIPDDELAERFVRSSGPGGQNVNKVSSKVELRWVPAMSRALWALGERDRAWVLGRLAPRLTDGGELIVVSTLTRDQIQNRGDARAKLVAILVAAMARPKARRATRPTRGSVERRIGEKKRRGEKKRDRRYDD